MTREDWRVIRAVLFLVALAIGIAVAITSFELHNTRRLERCHSSTISLPTAPARGRVREVISECEWRNPDGSTTVQTVETETIWSR